MALQSYTAIVGNLVDDSSGSNYGKYTPVYVKRLDGTNAAIFEDFDGNTPIVQDGIQNISNQKGEFTFFVEAGDYNINVGSGDVRVSIAGADYFNNKIEDLNRLFKATSIYTVDVPSIVDGLIVLPFDIPDPLVIVDGRILPDDGTFYTVNVDNTEIQLNVQVEPDSNVEIRYSNIVDGGAIGGNDYSVNTMAGLVAIPENEIQTGQQATTACYHNIFNGGGARFWWDESKPKSQHNGGTVIDPSAPYPNLWADIPQREAWYNSSNTGSGCWVMIKDESVNIKWFGAYGDYTTSNNRDDYETIKACFLNSESNIIVPEGNYHSRQSISNLLPAGRSLIGEVKHNNSIFSADVDGGVIENTTGQWWKNTFDNIVFDNRLTSTNAAGLKGTMYQCTIINCGFTSTGGKGLHLLGNAYCVENEIRSNYFNGCLHHIYAESGAYSNTDAYVIDNYFWRGSGSREANTINHIYWENASGSTFRGNHPYGGASDAMFRFEGGVNVSLAGNYFEESNNPRVKISSGNPGSFTLVGNKFWRSDGNATMDNGDQSALISLNFNLYNRGVLTLAGNIFEGGTNNVPIFSMRNGSLGVSEVKIDFDESNIISGSYSLANLAASGSADVNVLGRIKTTHSEFYYQNTVQNFAVSSVACSEFHQYDTGNATTFMTLPNHTNWCQWFPKILRNFSDTTEISLSSGSTIENNRAIKPGEVVIIRAVDSETYFIEFIKEDFVELEPTTYPLVTMNFGSTTVPANSYVESNIDVEGYALTNPNTILTCVMKGLAAGLVGTFYYDGVTFNTWKYRLTNLTGSAVTINSTTAIVTIF